MSQNTSFYNVHLSILLLGTSQNKLNHLPWWPLISSIKEAQCLLNPWPAWCNPGFLCWVMALGELRISLWNSFEVLEKLGCYFNSASMHNITTSQPPGWAMMYYRSLFLSLFPVCTDVFSISHPMFFKFFPLSFPAAWLHRFAPQ